MREGYHPHCVCPVEYQPELFDHLCHIRCVPRRPAECLFILMEDQVIILDGRDVNKDSCDHPCKDASQPSTPETSQQAIKRQRRKNECRYIRSARAIQCGVFVWER